MLEDKMLNLFYNTFKGNASFFVKHQAPFTEAEGKLKASWCGFAVYNKRNPPPEGKEYGDFIPVTKEQYREHLNGHDGLAIAPLTNTQDKKNVCFYAAIDIDVYGVSFTHLVNRLYYKGFKFAAFLSKSGGLHIYFFFVDAEQGDKVIETLERIVAVYGLGRLFVNAKNKSKVEVFPKQASFIPGDKNVNCLFLPFYNAANKSKQNMLTLDGKLIGITKALPIIRDMFTSVKELNNALDSLPYRDAPYCIQAILLSGALAENDGRNNFLFSAAIYLQKKNDAKDFKDALWEMNDCLDAPLGREDVNSIYTSVTTHVYDNYACRKPPCAGYCDKQLCALREYGVGRKRDNRFTGADCWGEITKICTKEPYYFWKVRVNPDEDFKTIRIDCADDLGDQVIVQKRCLRDLNWMPKRVKSDDWADIINRAMVGIEDRSIAVPKETDTTAPGVLHRLFLRYLTHKQIQNGQPYRVKLGQVYHADGFYYFEADGFVDFLRFERFSLGRINLNDWLTNHGCSAAVLTYKTSKGEEKAVECCKKPDDDELSAMAAFCEEVYEGDADIIRKNKLNKEDKGQEYHDDDAKF